MKQDPHYLSEPPRPTHVWADTADQLPPGDLALLLQYRSRARRLYVLSFVVLLPWVLIMPLAVWQQYFVLFVPGCLCAAAYLWLYTTSVKTTWRAYDLMRQPHPSLAHAMHTFGYFARFMRDSREFLLLNCSEQTLVRIGLLK